MDNQHVAAAKEMPPELIARLMASRDAAEALHPKLHAAAGRLATLDRRAADGEVVDPSEWEAAESDMIAVRREVARELRVFALRLKDCHAAVAPAAPAAVANEAGAVS